MKSKLFIVYLQHQITKRKYFIMNAKTNNNLNHYAIFLLCCILWQLVMIAGIKSMGKKAPGKGYTIENFQGHKEASM